MRRSTRHQLRNNRRRWRGARPRRQGARDRGAALAEFALIAPLLIILLFGIVELGIAMARAQSVEAAAREGARLASISTSSQADVEARVGQALAGIPLQNPATTTVTPGPCTGREGQTVTVTVSTVHVINIPVIGALPSNTITGQAVFRCEA